MRLKTVNKLKRIDRPNERRRSDVGFEEDTYDSDVEEVQPRRKGVI